KRIPETEDILKQQEAQAKAQRENENAVARLKGSTALTPDGTNAWLEVSTELDRFVGAPFVKFSKQGEYAVSDTESIPAGTRCVAHVDEAEFGWRYWWGGKSVHEKARMGRVCDRFVPPQRSELGELDQTQWEMDEQGAPRDPYQFN